MNATKNVNQSITINNTLSTPSISSNTSNTSTNSGLVYNPSTTTGQFNNIYNPSTTTSSSFSTVNLLAEYFTKDEAKENFMVLENLLKPIILASNLFTYDRQLSKEELLKIIKEYIIINTDKDVNVSFIKSELKETLYFVFKDNHHCSLSNKEELTIDIYFYYKDIFYINTEKLLKLVKKTVFSCLLNI